MRKEENPEVKELKEVLKPSEDRIAADYEERAEPNGYRVRVFTRIDFEKGNWSQDHAIPAGCINYTCKSDMGCHIDITIARLVIQRYKASKGNKVIVCNTTATLDEGITRLDNDRVRIRPKCDERQGNVIFP